MRGVVWGGLVFCVAALSAVEPAAVERLPEAAKAARKKHSAALAEAREAYELASLKAGRDLAQDLTKLQESATKAGNLDQALALRDAAKSIMTAAEVKPVAEWLKENRRFKAWWGETYWTFGPEGWSNDGGTSGRIEVVNADTVRTWSAEGVGKGFSGTWTFSLDRSRVLLETPDLKQGVMTAVK